MRATWTKLRSGEWGLRVTGGSPRSGDRVTVTKRNGESRVVAVGRIIWRGDGATLCTVGLAQPAQEHRAPQREDDWERRQDARDEAEYQRGVAEGRRYSSDRAIYGAELAEQWEMEAEMAAWNRGEVY